LLVYEERPASITLLSRPQRRFDLSAANPLPGCPVLEKR
jgi:hypothetical protein